MMADVRPSSTLRQRERHGAASLRAIAGVPSAEYRANRMRVAGIPQPFASPHLVADFGEITLTRSRSIVDSLGLRLRHSDYELHQQLTPSSNFASILFDIFEQLRCESLAPRACQGIRSNIAAGFVGWCQQVHADGMADSELGVLLYTVVHMVRARLMGTIEDESAESLIEATRANLGPVLGLYLKGLQHLVDDQAAFAVPAKAISEAIEAMIDSDDLAIDDSDSAKERHSIILPPDWNKDTLIDASTVLADAVTASYEEQLDAAGGYHVFTRQYDVEIEATALYRTARIQTLRRKLDQGVQSQAVSLTKLARSLQRLFADLAIDGWLFGQEEGLIDARRLAQMVSNSAYAQVFKQELSAPSCDTVVSFLVDNSGSMKKQRFAAVAVLLDTFCRALQMIDVATEVLGFTTADWNGGRAMRDWRKTGSPDNPGRLGETLHVVYKDADTHWRRARPGLACMLETQHFREGVDGEALVWAYRRLQARPERSRYLVVISDGAPMDTATHNTNQEGFLASHLSAVAQHIHKQTDIRLGGVGIDLDLSDMYPNSIASDLNGTLGNANYRLLHELFVHPARS